MGLEQPISFNDRRDLIPRSLTYVFSLRIEYLLAIPGVSHLPEQFCLPMAATGASTFHVQGDDVVASVSNQALEWPKFVGAGGISDLFLSGASSEGFGGKLLFEVDGARRIAVDHVGRLIVGGGTRRINQLRGQSTTSKVTGAVRAAFRFTVDNPRFRWLEFNQLVGVGNFEVCRADSEQRRIGAKPACGSVNAAETEVDEEALSVAADFDLYIAF